MGTNRRLAMRVRFMVIRSDQKIILIFTDDSLDTAQKRREEISVHIMKDKSNSQGATGCQLTGCRVRLVIQIKHDLLDTLRNFLRNRRILIDEPAYSRHRDCGVPGNIADGNRGGPSGHNMRLRNRLQ
jgi:hypothetical protein